MILQKVTINQVREWRVIVLFVLLKQMSYRAIDDRFADEK